MTLGLLAIIAVGIIYVVLLIDYYPVFDRFLPHVLGGTPDVMPQEPDQPYMLDGVTTAMTQGDWDAPPYREITCPCGWRSRLAERVLDAQGLEMRTNQYLEIRAHYRTCEHAHLPLKPEETVL